MLSLKRHESYGNSSSAQSAVRTSYSIGENPQLNGQTCVSSCWDVELIFEGRCSEGAGNCSSGCQSYDIGFGQNWAQNCGQTWVVEERPGSQCKELSPILVSGEAAWKGVQVRHSCWNGCRAI